MDDEEQTEQTEDEDSDFSSYVAEVESNLDEDDAAIARQHAVNARTDKELAAFSIADVAERGAWHELPVSAISALNDDQLGQFMEWRDRQPRDAGLDEDERAYDGVTAEESEGRQAERDRLMPMSDRDFELSLRTSAGDK